jgi:hypothetical protein
LGVPFKIRKGRIQIIEKFLLCEKGKKINDKQVNILKKLDMKIHIHSLRIVAAYMEGVCQIPESSNTWIEDSEDEQWESSSEEEEEDLGGLFD